MKRGKKSFLCRLGVHGPQGGQGAVRWCLGCGTTWESTYDGMESSWRKRRDLRFGEVESQARREIA